MLRVRLSVVLCVAALAWASDGPAISDRFMRYDRSSGETALLTQVTGACAAKMNSTSAAVWSSSGLQIIDVATGQSSVVTSTPYSSSNKLALTDRYLRYNDKLLDLQTGTTTTISIPAGAYYYGDSIAYKVSSPTDGPMTYAVRNLMTGAEHNVEVPTTGHYGYPVLRGLTEGSAVIDYIAEGRAGWFYYTWYLSDTTTGDLSRLTYTDTFTSEPSFSISEGWFLRVTAADYDQYQITPRFPGLQSLLWSDPYGWVFSLGPDAVVRTIPWDLYWSPGVQVFDGTSASWFTIPGTHWSSQSPWDSPIYNTAASINADYVTWVDNRPVPEPGSLLALGSFLGLATVWRKRTGQSQKSEGR